MFGDGPLTFREFGMREPVPLARIHDAVLEFVRDRDDAALYGAQAVNANVEESRMTQEVDIASVRALDPADALRLYLNQRFHIAMRAREIRNGLAYRIYQVQKPKNRYLVDLWPVAELPPAQRVADVLVVTPPELIAGKVIAFHDRRTKPKSGTDWRDLAMLLLKFPEWKQEDGPVAERPCAANASQEVMAAWKEIVAESIEPEDEDAEFN